MEIEQRSFRAEMSVDDADQQIRGVAAVYNQPSSDLGGFIEIIEPGFFSDVLADDVRALWNHNDDLPLGRIKAGTLAIEDTEQGLAVNIKLPDTQAGRDARVSIGRGDVDQMSFAFTVRTGGARWDKSGERVVRYLMPGGCAHLYDVSPVTFPAYPQTSVGLRNQFEAFMRSQTAEADPGTNQAGPTGTAQGEAAQARHERMRKSLQIKSKTY